MFSRWVCLACHLILFVISLAGEHGWADLWEWPVLLPGSQQFAQGADGHLVLCGPAAAATHHLAVVLRPGAEGKVWMEGRKEMFYLTTHSTHFIYGYMVSDIWLRTIMIVRNKTRCSHICYSFRLTARVLLYAPSHRQGSTYHSLCYTSCGALAGTRNSSVGPPHEGSIRRPIAPWANAFTTELYLAPK